MIKQNASDNQTVPVNPRNIKFVQETVSPSFTTNSDNGPGEMLDSVVAKIKNPRNKLKADAFPSLKVFGLFNRTNRTWEWFSLSNRRLYVFKKAGCTTIKTELAHFDDIIDSIWKLTNESGGERYPILTNAGKKEARPGKYTTLALFRNYVETTLPIFERNIENPRDELKTRLLAPKKSLLVGIACK